MLTIIQMCRVSLLLAELSYMYHLKGVTVVIVICHRTPSALEDSLILV